jgi:hypothetical protein
MTAHSGVDDPAAVVGSDERKRRLHCAGQPVAQLYLDLAHLPLTTPYSSESEAKAQGDRSLGVDVPRMLAAEAVGTALLFAIVVGSGIMGERRLAGGTMAIALLAYSLATGSGLRHLVSHGALTGRHVVTIKFPQRPRGFVTRRFNIPCFPVQWAATLPSGAHSHDCLGARI